MDQYIENDKFRLEIHWSKVNYINDYILKFINCYLIGPVINELNQLNNDDYIMLDFTKQYKIFIPAYYIARFSWSGVEYKPNLIKLQHAVLENKYINSVPILNNDDYIIIDTSKHTEDKHHMFLTYDAYVVKYDKQIYQFGD